MLRSIAAPALRYSSKHEPQAWDPEASVWVAESDDIPLVTEAPTIAALQAKLPALIADLLEVEENGQELEVAVELIWHAHELVRIRSRAA